MSEAYLLPGHVVDGRLIEGGFHVRGTHPDDPPVDITADASSDDEDDPFPFVDLDGNEIP